MNNCRAIFIHGPELERGGYPASCPFNTRRAGRTRQIVHSLGLLNGPDVREVAPRPAGREELERFHLPAYLDLLEAAATGAADLDLAAAGLGALDCPVFADIFRYPALACGGTLEAARLLMAGTAPAVFNPSGGFHHAGPASAAGFCYLNDIVLSAALLADHGWRVLVLDVDVHHGDGAQAAFYERDDILTVSLHETGETLYPGTGAAAEIGRGAGTGYSVNVPLPPGTDDEIYMHAFTNVGMPVIEVFTPDCVVMQLGMDALAGDPLAHLRLSNNTHASVLQRIFGLGCPLLVTGGGGYHFEKTTRGWSLMWSILCGDEDDESVLNLGGELLENAEWRGGLRDRPQAVRGGRHRQVREKVDRTLTELRRRLFPLHGL